ncbi:HepT-like ribonuclease domain-containing protein [Baaleninema simplex]|uniref:HepT-like ribonuclease domain-containing protein n=1 Tax=Baaleninema simplex TaxID=2862350 RepID=UPI000344C467|nr:DUF86 domain-containing protein [Baaleninema simplex]
MKDDRLYLANIRDCIDRIETYTRNDRAAFFANPMIQDAVIRNLEIIGEATKNLTPELRTRYSDIPWRQIAGLRDVLIHDYLNVNLDRVWGVVEQNLPPLKQQVLAILDDI